MRMRASAPGLVLADGQVSVQTLGKPKDEPIEQDLTLVPAVLVTGRVLSADGKPVAAVRVSAKAKTKDQDFDFTQMLGSPRGMQALTDTAGRYTLDGVAGGVKQLHMEAVTEDGLEAKSEPVDLPERGEVRIGDLRLPRTHTLQVTVVDDVGAPVAEAAVSVVLADRMFGEVHRRAHHPAQREEDRRDPPDHQKLRDATDPTARRARAGLGERSARHGSSMRGDGSNFPNFRRREGSELDSSACNESCIIYVSRLLSVSSSCGIRILRIERSERRQSC